ncbi:MAG: CPBP family glutamic-type intramembrane protease [Promethearchaeota archaeon]
MLSQQDSKNKQDSSRAIIILGIFSCCIFAISGMDFIGYFTYLFLNSTGAEGYTRSLFNVFLGFGGTFLSLFLIPVIFIKKWDRGTRFSQLGSQIGKKKIGIYFVILALLCIPLLYLGSANANLIQTYPLSKNSLQSWPFFIFYEICYIFLYYVPYEFFFRGVLHFSLSKSNSSENPSENPTENSNLNLKSWKLWRAILYVTALTTLLHITKPITEIIGAIIAGILFGLITEKTKSWYWVFFLHIIIGVSTDIFCGLRFLGIIG